MKVLELYAGKRSIGRQFERFGHEVFSVDWSKEFDDIDWYVDIGTITVDDILERFGRPDVVWMSPDCTTYSMAAISHHRPVKRLIGCGVDTEVQALSPYAETCDRINTHTRQLIESLCDLGDMLWFIENPRAKMRKMSFMDGMPRYTVTYCQYGDTRMKPTDIWTNHPDPRFRPPCKNGDPCHTSAPRGSRTGTQGLTGKENRSLIPEKLCEHIVEICEEYFL